MIFRPIEVTVGKEIGFSFLTLIWSDQVFNAAVAAIYSNRDKQLLVCLLGIKWFISFGEKE